MSTIQVNSLNYVRNNLIEMRRIAKASENQAAKLEQYVIESRRDAKDVNRLSFLTMAFLPTTALAVIMHRGPYYIVKIKTKMYQTIFSMPFLTLDDNLEFRAIGRIWVFVIPSTLLTALVFAASFTWDIISSQRDS
jgi:hypothetical protein